MAYNKAQVMQDVCVEMAKGRSLKNICDSDDDLPSRETIRAWIAADDAISAKYARAAELRADHLFDEMFDIADDSTKDIQEVELPDGRFIDKVDYEYIQRSKLRIDTRKWALSKMNPKKYSDKVDITTNQESINKPVDSKEIMDNITKVLNGGSIPESRE